MCEISALEKLVTARIIQEDAETIYSLLQTERDSIFSMGVIPYYVLFVQSCQEYMRENFLSESILYENNLIPLFCFVTLNNFAIPMQE